MDRGQSGLTVLVELVVEDASETGRLGPVELERDAMMNLEMRLRLTQSRVFSIVSPCVTAVCEMITKSQTKFQLAEMEIKDKEGENERWRIHNRIDVPSLRERENEGTK